MIFNKRLIIKVREMNGKKQYAVAVRVKDKRDRQVTGFFRESRTPFVPLAN